jgi:hypothetical protein
MFPTSGGLTMEFVQAPHADFDVARHAPTEHYLGLLTCRAQARLPEQRHD